MSAPVSLQIIFGFFMFAAVFVTLERCVPLRRRQGPFRPGWATDVVWYAAGCFVAKTSDAASFGGMLLIRELTGLGAGGMAAAQPAWLQFFEILILADFLAYLFHRSIHRFDLLWRLHRVHHSSERMDWLANVRLHPLDKLLGDCFQFIPIFLLGFASGPVLAYTIFLGFQGFLNHSNVRLNYGPLRWIVAGPEFHHWHHCLDPKAHNKNFSPHLVVFDLLFGTFYLPPDRSMPAKYGIPEAMPEGFWAQIMCPFRRPGPGRAGNESVGQG
jgi:sterol desaturase/sphingolipid hydroxylase (fatty acid hydroxylase superfamily)